MRQKTKKYFFPQDAFNRSKKLSDGKTFVKIACKVNRVFSPEQELRIVEYAIQAARMFYGLPMKEFRKMAYEYAKACGSQTIPEVWEAKGRATRDWYYSFMERHPSLGLKVAEGMSIARITAFNKVTVEAFFKAYTEALEKYEFSPDRIYNMDESSLSTVMKPVKVVCERGRPVASQVTRERGNTMTFVGIVNAVGQSLPPVFIIPRCRMNPAFMRNTLYGSKGILQRNGWMDGECFVETLQHLHETTGSSVEKKIMLIMDNAEGHMNIHVVEYAIEHGIVIVTLPPHTTDKLQPLDVSVFGPFKTFLRGILNDYSLMHPNTHITVHQLPQFASEAWTKAGTPSNILAGFRSTGIWPVNRHIFPEEAFVAAQVTERPAPPQEFSVEVAATLSEGEEELDDGHVSEANSPDLSTMPPEDDLMTQTVGSEEPCSLGTPARPIASSAADPATPGPSTPGPSHDPSTPGPSNEPSTPGPSSSTTKELTPENIRPFPKATPRPYGRGRKRVRSCILTEDEEAIADLRDKASRKQKALEKKRGGKAPRGRPKKSAPVPPVEVLEEDTVDDVVMMDDSSSDFSEDFGQDDDQLPYPFAEKEPEVRDIIYLQKNPYKLAKFYFIYLILSLIRLHLLFL